MSCFVVAGETIGPSCEEDYIWVNSGRANISAACANADPCSGCAECQPLPDWFREDAPDLPLLIEEGGEPDTCCAACGMTGGDCDCTRPDPVTVFRKRSAIPLAEIVAEALKHLARVVDPDVPADAIAEAIRIRKLARKARELLK